MTKRLGALAPRILVTRQEGLPRDPCALIVREGPTGIKSSPLLAIVGNSLLSVFGPYQNCVTGSLLVNTRRGGDASDEQPQLHSAGTV